METLSILLDLRNFQEQVKKAFGFKNSTELSLYEQIVLVNSKCLRILGLQPWISKVFLDHKNNFFFTLAQNNFENKIVFFIFLQLFFAIFIFYFLGHSWNESIKIRVGNGRMVQFTWSDSYWWMGLNTSQIKVIKVIFSLNFLWLIFTTPQMTNFMFSRLFSNVKNKLTQNKSKTS